MTNTVAAWLAGLLVAGAIADAALNDGDVLFFIAINTVHLIDWLSFWR